MGSNGTIKVTGADLEQMATDMKSANDSIKTRLDDLHTKLMNTFGATWSGAAREAYDTAKAQWDTQIAEMNQIMTDAHNNVISSQEQYAAGDKRAAGFF